MIVSDRRPGGSNRAKSAQPPALITEARRSGGRAFGAILGTFVILAGFLYVLGVM